MSQSSDRSRSTKPGRNTSQNEENASSPAGSFPTSPAFRTGPNDPSVSSQRTPSNRSQQPGDWSTFSTPRGMRTPRSPATTGSQHSQGGHGDSSTGTPVRQRFDLSGGLGHRRTRGGLQTPGGQTTEGAFPTRTPSPMANNDEEEAHTFVWGTDVDVQDIKRRVNKFLQEFADEVGSQGKYMRLLEEIVEREGDTFNIDCMNIHTFDLRLYKLLLRYPLEVIPIFDIVVGDLAAEISPEYSVPILTRLFNLKDSVNLRDLNPSDIDQLISIKGMVIRSSSIIPELKFACFQCLVCHHVPPLVMIERGRVNEPGRCQRSECASRGSMALIHNRSRFINKQIVRLQETPDAIPEGETPHTVSLCMFDSLVDACKPGDRVEITGVFRAQPLRIFSRQRSLKSLYKTYVDCIHVKKQEKGRLLLEDMEETDPNSEYFPSFQEGTALPEEYLQLKKKLTDLSKEPDIYEKLSRSLAPSIWELEDIKKGLLCQLFGGNSKKMTSGAQIRGDINVLLVGDPGTSKSQLLQYVHKIAPRGIYTSGRGSSAVGLTAYVSKDPETREMILESGALVLSDKGICCIDEFDKMSENARSMLHEVMEQQTVSVAKAGIIASLNARTSVLACANPSGSRYNPRLSVIDNIQLPPTLLSRFDLIYLMLDKPNEQTDRKLARFLVGLHYEEPEMRVEAFVDPVTLSQYISHARMHIHPKLTDEAADELVKAYKEMRGKGLSRKVITATPRQLESLIRVSEALARARFSELVETKDVVEAMRLLVVAMQQSATDPSTGTIDMDLITTGISTSARIKRSQIVSAVKEFLLDKFSGEGSQLRTQMILDEMKMQTREELTLQDVRDAVLSLQSEGFLQIRGDLVTMS